MAIIRSKINLLTYTTRIPTFILLVLFIPEVFSESNVTSPSVSNEKCEYKPCGDDPHTMCRYPAKLDKSQAKCSGEESKAGLNRDYRKAILEKHNQLRQKVAQGKAGQPKAANMMKLKWDMELEKIAQRFVNSCPSVGHDTCRDLKDGTSVGQNSGSNVFKYKEKLSKAKFIAGVVEGWYDEVKDMQPSFVDDISSSSDDFSKIGHYSQVVWAETDRLGCGYLEYNYEDPFQYILLDCNYAVAGNMMNPNTPVYEKGEPCSKCPKGTHCSKIYPGLCTAEKKENKYAGIPSGKGGKGAGTPAFGGASWSVILVVLIIRNLM